MSKPMNDDEFAYIIERLKEYAKETMDGLSKDPKDAFLQGKSLAYQEIFGTIKNQLLIYGNDVEGLGMDIDVENRTFIRTRNDR